MVVFIPLDLQGQYLKNRVKNRTYTMPVEKLLHKTKGKYENLKSVIVSFILTGAPMNLAISNTKIMLQDIKTNQLYSDLLTIHEVNRKRISASNGENICIYRLSEEERLEERQEGKIEIAKNALKMGLNIKQIKELTGLSEEEISNLK